MAENFECHKQSPISLNSVSITIINVIQIPKITIELLLL